MTVRGSLGATGQRSACYQQAATLNPSTGGGSLTAVPGKRRRLAERRKMVGHAQERIAALLGVDRTTVQRWEAGETTPQPWLRPKLAEALAVSLDELDAMLAEGQEEQAGDDGPSTNSKQLPDDSEHDPVLVTPWNHRGTVEAATALRGGEERVKRRVILALPALR
jgi:transcriptional regulator with XRE-family HTH domain